jgi:hypothetical protein
MFNNKKFHPTPILRRIDVALLKSKFAQFFYGLVLAVSVLCILLIVQIPFSVTGKDIINAFVNNSVDAGKETELLLILANLLSKILIGGILISIIVNMLLRRIEQLQSGQVYYRFRNHTVIIGYDTITAGLIMQVFKKYPANEIVLQTMQEASKVRNELFPKLTADIKKRVTIVVGNRNENEDLRKLCLDEAQELFILGESNESNRDSFNIESLKKINEILKARQAKQDMPCYVLFENQSAFAVLQQHDVSELRIKITQDNTEETITYLNFYPFNISDVWAQKLFVNCRYNYGEDSQKTIEYQPLDRSGIDYESDKTVHLVILGMSKMGVALGIQASHLCHFPNFIRDNRLKTRITLIDENADKEMYYLQSRYRYFFEEIDYTCENMEQPNRKPKQTFTDIRWHFIKGRAEHPNIQEKLKMYAGEENSLLTVAVCFNVPEKAIACGLYLPDEVYKSGAQILIKQDTPYSILSMLHTTDKYKNVKYFGMSEYVLDLSRNDDLLPMLVNYVYDRYYNHQEIPQSIPHVAELEKSWKGLRTAKKWSNRYNANMLDVKKRSFDIRLEKTPDETTIQRLAEVEHNRWNIEELLLGYRPTTEAEKRLIGSDKTLKQAKKEEFIHNDICPYCTIADMDIIESDLEKVKNTREYDICLSKSIPLILEHLNSDKK